MQSAPAHFSNFASCGCFLRLRLSPSRLFAYLSVLGLHASPCLQAGRVLLCLLSSILLTFPLNVVLALLVQRSSFLMMSCLLRCCVAWPPCVSLRVGLRFSIHMDGFVLRLVAFFYDGLTFLRLPPLASHSLLWRVASPCCPLIACILQTFRLRGTVLTILRVEPRASQLVPFRSSDLLAVLARHHLLPGADARVLAVGA